MVKGKRKGQTMIYKILHRNLKIEQHEPHKKNRVDEPMCPDKVSIPCFTSDSRRVTV
jgi:hypothetical protein